VDRNSWLLPLGEEDADYHVRFFVYNGFCHAAMKSFYGDSDFMKTLLVVWVEAGHV
jgi:hypothetical protein